MPFGFGDDVIAELSQALPSILKFEHCKYKPALVKGLILIMGLKI